MADVEDDTEGLCDVKEDLKVRRDNDDDDDDDEVDIEESRSDEGVDSEVFSDIDDD